MSEWKPTARDAGHNSRRPPTDTFQFGLKETFIHSLEDKSKWDVGTAHCAILLHTAYLFLCFLLPPAVNELLIN